MWMTVVAVLALTHAGQAFCLSGVSFPKQVRNGDSITLKFDLTLGTNESVMLVEWTKDFNPFLAYTEIPKRSLNHTDVSGVTVDKDDSTERSVVLTKATPGLYTLDVQVMTPLGTTISSFEQQITVSSPQTTV